MNDVAMHIGQVYAAALFDLAAESKLVDAIKNDLAVIGEVVDDPEFRAVGKSPAFSLEFKSQLVRKLFGGRVTDLTMDFLMVMVRRNRLGQFAQAKTAYDILWDRLNGYTDVHVTLAAVPDDAQVQNLTQEIEAAMQSRVRLQTAVNESILGGIIIRYGDSLIDNSARTQLERAVKAITSRKAEKINEV